MENEYNLCMNIIQLPSAFSKIPDYWHPRIAGELNDSYIKLAKLKGEFVWHQHELEDELFLVISGTLIIQTRAGDHVLHPGEFLIIPRGVEHRPVAEEEVHVLLVEPKTTVNTGNVQSEYTVKADWLEGLEHGAG
jgi:mannose-6-phosphate isomerase-like protein (cupin superfamily)